ncbi:MAG TPA: HNH endonuclease signature motif containing protein [Streptosporangiaceae bacterium]
MPPLTDADAPDPDDSYADPPSEPPDHDRLRYGEDPLDLPDTGPTPAWPPIPGTTGISPLTMTGTGASGVPGVAARTSSANGLGRPVSGMLDLTLSWATFAESASAPGNLGRIGPVTATQARALAATASNAPGTRWRVILTDHHGHAVNTATITRHLTPDSQAGTASSYRTSGPMLPLAGPAASITGRVSVTVPAAALDHISAAGLAGTSTRAAVLRAAAKAAAKARRQNIADQEADDGCAHTTASPAYRPPLTIRDLIEARDQACRFPGCRQPAWRGDLDHTTPFHCGGLTCPCNLGPLCRRHHRLKQQQHWALTQTTPGTFRWKTSAGRIHATTAHQHSP